MRISVRVNAQLGPTFFFRRPTRLSSTRSTQARKHAYTITRLRAHLLARKRPFSTAPWMSRRAYTLSRIRAFLLARLAPRLSTGHPHPGKTSAQGSMGRDACKSVYVLIRMAVRAR